MDLIGHAKEELRFASKNYKWWVEWEDDEYKAMAKYWYWMDMVEWLENTYDEPEWPYWENDRIMTITWEPVDGG